MTSIDFSVRVEAGEIEVDGVYRVLDTELAKAWYVHLGSGHAEIRGWGHGDQGQGGDSGHVLLGATGNTVDANEELAGELTAINFPAPHGWAIQAECFGRMCRIVTYQVIYRD